MVSLGTCFAVSGAMPLKLLVISLLTATVGCAGSAPTQVETVRASEGFRCEYAFDEAAEAWTAYAVELRLDGLRANAEAADRYARAASAYAAAAQEVATARSARLEDARAIAARQAAADAARAAERAELVVDDAISDAENPARFQTRFSFMREEAAQAIEEARRSASRAEANHSGDLERAARLIASANESKGEADRSFSLADEADDAVRTGELASEHPSRTELTHARTLSEAAEQDCRG
jgi:hypothetical protein